MGIHAFYFEDFLRHEYMVCVTPSLLCGHSSFFVFFAVILVLMIAWDALWASEHRTSKKGEPDTVSTVGQLSRVEVARPFWLANGAAGGTDGLMARHCSS